MKNLSFLGVVVLVLFSGCGRNSAQEPVQEFVFAKGADVGWLTQMEASGIKFYNSSGVEQECMQILKDKGINSIRVRAWVNPKDGWNNTKDVVVKALRAKNLGMRIMIDFHYSDTWADPGHQPKPAAWASYTFEQLQAAISSYTKGVMDTLKMNSITPDWVQVGNETNDGMLWEDGRASTHLYHFASFVKAGYDAVKAVSPTTKVIVHLSNGYDNVMFRTIFDGLKANGTTWDIIGMSLYPNWFPGGVNDWQNANTQCLTNMNDMIARYGTPVMIVEAGAPADQPDLTKAFLSDLIAKTKSIKDNNGLGVFYWEPESYNNWNGYNLGAFDSTGKPTIAMDAFLN